MLVSPLSFIQVDDSLWPLVIVRYQGSPTTAQLEQFLARRVRELERGERHVVIHDLSRSSGQNPPDQRRMQLDWLKRHEPQMRQLNLGAALIIQSTFVRLGVSVLLHLRPTAIPHTAVSTYGEAALWLAERLRLAGLEAEARVLRTRFGPSAEAHAGAGAP